ncbi:coiled-coil domain-containing protein 42 homolog [Halichoeres trimaculatus]|uniref:coiled-coil domain-containing protein 42 homolog n=1 Tax=Halichoeres trimaculatus TaxID=147232 RepID=UPI003D9E877E
MDRMEKEPRKMSAGPNRETAEDVNLYRVSVLLDIQKKEEEEKDLEAKIVARKQKLEYLKTQIQEMQEKIKKLGELRLDIEMLQKEESPDRAERGRKDELQRDEEERRLKEEAMKLTEKKEELRLQLERHAVFKKYMELVVKMTRFEEAQQLTTHIENLLHFREQLCQREAESDNEVEEKKKALSVLKEQHHLVQLQGNNQLSQLQNELSTALSEVSTWEKRWIHIQETAAKKTLKLGEIKMAILNLYEMTCGNEGKEEAVDIHDTERQLDKVKIFLKDYNEFLRQQTAKMRQRTEEHGKIQKT